MIKHKTSREVSMGSVLVVDHLPGVYRTAGGDGGASCKGNPGSTGRGHAPRRWSSPFKSLLSFKLRSGAAVCVDAMGIKALQRTRDSFPKTKMELLLIVIIIFYFDLCARLYTWRITAAISTHQ
jgi:hypothetical protein